MLRNIFIIAKRTIGENLKIKKNLIYLGIVLLLAILFNLNISSYIFNVNQINAQIASTYYMWLLFIGAGLPFFIYICYISSSSINKELNDGTALMLFTRPLSRTEFIIGKFIGILGYITIINAVLFLLIPAILNLFYGADLSLWIIYKLSFIFLIFSVLFSTAFVAISIFLSSILKHSVTVFLIMIAIIIFIYFAPIINTIIGTSVAPNLIKPIIGSTITPLTSSGNITSDLMVLNSVYGTIFYKIGTGEFTNIDIITQAYHASLILLLCISIVLSIGFLLLTIYFFAKKDIS